MSGTAECPTPCDTDCAQLCHEIHTVRSRRGHQPRDCPAFLAQPLEVRQHDIDASAFPMVIELFRVDTGEVVWREEVHEPRAVKIPALAGEYAVPIGARVIYAHEQP